MSYEFYRPDWFSDYPWQPEGIKFCAKNKRVLIPLPTGATKTYVALGTIHALQLTKFLVVCSGNALYTWQKNIALHLPTLALKSSVISKMNKPQRQKIYDDPNIDIIVMPFKTFVRDKDLIKKKFQAIIGDECHNYTRNKKTDSYKALYDICQESEVVLFLSATPTSRGRQELWPLLHILNPKYFDSFWQFVNKYTIVDRASFGVSFLGPQNTVEFRKHIQRYVYYPSMPITGLPEVVRSSLYVELEGDIENIYRQMDEEMYIHIENGLLTASNVLAKITRLRQLLVCPAILDERLGYGDGVDIVIDHMHESLEERTHAVWFTPFTEAIPHFIRAIREKLPTVTEVVVFQSGMDLEELKHAEEVFRKNKNSVAICSINFAQSFELETGYPAYFLGCSFDPFVNMQAEGRLKRPSAKNKVIPAYYVQHLGTYEDRLLEINGNKFASARVDMINVQAIKTLLAAHKTS